MQTLSKGQTEAKITEAILKFEKEYMGRGPIEGKTYIIKDMVLVRLKGVLTLAEEQLAKTAEGAELIKKLRVQLLESAKVLLNKIISDITNKQVVSLHSDISTKTGERVIIFTLDVDYEEEFGS